MGVTIINYVQDGERVEKYVHKQDAFPSYFDLKAYAEEDNIRVDDFRHRRQSETFFVGDLIRAGGKSGKIRSGRRGLKFLIRCDTPPKYEDLLR